MSLINELSERRVLPAVGVYIGASWVVVEILDRLVERYFLSPYLTDAVFWGLYSLVPAVILIAWTHGRPGKDKSTRAEKVGVPINIIATIGLLVTVFGNKDMSATADLVQVSNELGQQEQRYIPREAYRSHLAVFFFEGDELTSEDQWLQYAVSDLLVQDLQQNPFMMVTSPRMNVGYGMYNLMEQAGYDEAVGMPLSLKREIARNSGKPYFVVGAIGKAAGQFELSLQVWNSKDLSSVGKWNQSGWDLLELVDEASSQVREILDVPAAKGGLAGDLPLHETYGESEQALRALTLGQNEVLLNRDWPASNSFYDQALEADPEFVMAWFQKGANFLDQGDLAAAQGAFSKAQRLDYRLPETDQVILKSALYRLGGEQDKLEKLLTMQTRVVGSAESWRQWAQFHKISGDLEAARQGYLQVLDIDQADHFSYINIAQIDRALGNWDSAADFASRYVDANSNDPKGHILMGNLMMETGEFDSARDSYEQAQLLESTPIMSTLKMAHLAIRQGHWSEARSHIEHVKQLAVTEQQLAMANGVEQVLEMRLGRITRAIELVDELGDVIGQVVTPIDQLFSTNVPMINYYVVLDRLEDADQLMQQTYESVQPPFNEFLALVEGCLRAKQSRLDEAEAAVDTALAVIDRFKAEYLMFQVSIVQAIIEEERGNLAQAAAHYEDAIDQARRSVLVQNLSNEISMLAGAAAQMYVKAGDLKKAQAMLESAFRADDSEPMLWVAQAMLQRASGNPQMARASLGYALAIWSEADADYTEYVKAVELNEELSTQGLADGS